MKLQARLVKLIEFCINEYLSLPGLMRLGLIILLIGAALDMFYHLAPASWVDTATVLLGRDGYNAHLVTLVGMLVMMTGLFQGIWSIRMQRVADRSSAGKEVAPR